MNTEHALIELLVRNPEEALELYTSGALTKDMFKSSITPEKPDDKGFINKWKIVELIAKTYEKFGSEPTDEDLKKLNFIPDLDEKITKIIPQLVEQIRKDYHKRKEFLFGREYYSLLASDPIAAATLKETHEKWLDVFDNTLTGASDVIWGKDVEINNTKYITQPLIPKALLTIVAGKKYAGKTQFLIKLAADATRGDFTKLGDSKKRKPNIVLYFSIEDTNSETLVPRFLAMGGDINKFALIKGNKIISFKDLPFIKKQLKEVKPDLVIFDNMATYNDGSDMNLTNKMMNQLTPLIKLAEGTERNIKPFALVVAAHWRKDADSGDFDDRISGSGVFANRARSIIHIIKDSFDDREFKDIIIVQTKITGLVPLPPIRTHLQPIDFEEDVDLSNTKLAKDLELEELSVAKLIIDGRSGRTKDEYENPKKAKEQTEFIDTMNGVSVMIDDKRPLSYDEIINIKKNKKAKNADDLKIAIEFIREQIKNSSIYTVELSEKATAVGIDEKCLKKAKELFVNFKVGPRTHYGTQEQSDAHAKWVAENKQAAADLLKHKYDDTAWAEESKAYTDEKGFFPALHKTPEDKYTFFGATKEEFDKMKPKDIPR